MYNMTIKTEGRHNSAYLAPLLTFFSLFYFLLFLVILLQKAVFTLPGLLLPILSEINSITVIKNLWCTLVTQLKKRGQGKINIEHRTKTSMSQWEKLIFLLS